MALRPTGPRILERRPTRPGRLQRSDMPAEATPALSEQQPRPRRLATATNAAEIDAQINWLITLMSNDNIDPKAPPGSYLNILV